MKSHVADPPRGDEGRPAKGCTDCSTEVGRITYPGWRISLHAGWLLFAGVGVGAGFGASEWGKVGVRDPLRTLITPSHRELFSKIQSNRQCFARGFVTNGPKRADALLKLLVRAPQGADRGRLRPLPNVEPASATGDAPP